MFIYYISHASLAGRKSENQDTVLAQKLCLTDLFSKKSNAIVTPISLTSASQIDDFMGNDLASGTSADIKTVSKSANSTKQSIIYPPCVLVGVADGVSICRNPKRASQLAVKQFSNQIFEHMRKLWQAHDGLSMQVNGTTQAQHTQSISSSDLHVWFAQSIAHAIQSANDSLYFSDETDLLGSPRQHLPPLLTTLSGVLMYGGQAHLFHTGDSRVYRYRLPASSAIAVKSSKLSNNPLEQLSHDHRHHKGRDKGALTAALGAGALVDLHYDCYDVKPKDVWLIMTDGVYEHVSDTEMQVLVHAVTTAAVARERNQRLQDLPDKLCQAAYENGSRDNISCVAVLVEEGVDASHAQCLLTAPYANNCKHDAQLLKISTTSLKIPAALSVGQYFEGFLVKQILHHTARSSVYVVQNAEGSQYVLKAPSPYFDDDADFLRLFLKEEKIGLTFNHDSLLKFYPKPAESTHLYHLTEYVIGNSLRHHLDTYAPLSLTETHNLIQRIGLALRVMHRNYLLHQDIKPENVLITDSHAIKLIDFGSVGSLILKHALTPPAGDLNYTAPEYYSDAPKGVHSEVFSLGVMAYEMLTGHLPFSNKAIVRAGKHDDRLDFTNVRELQPNLPYWLNDVLARAMHPDLRSRYVSVGEFISELDPVAHTGDRHKPPLIVRHPVRFWQGVSALLALLLFACLFKLMSFIQ